MSSCPQLYRRSVLDRMGRVRQRLGGVTRSPVRCRRLRNALDRPAPWSSGTFHRPPSTSTYRLAISGETGRRSETRREADRSALGRSPALFYERVRFQNAWFTLHIGNTAKYLADLTSAKRACVQASLRENDQERGGLLLADALRYQLLDASIRSTIRSLSPHVVGALLKRGKWTPQEALTHIEFVAASSDPHSYLSELAHVLGPAGCTQAMSLIGSIEKPADSACAIAALQQIIGPEADSEARALEAALESISDPVARLQTISTIAKRWPAVITPKLFAVFRDAANSQNAASVTPIVKEVLSSVQMQPECIAAARELLSILSCRQGVAGPTAPDSGPTGEPVDGNPEEELQQILNSEPPNPERKWDHYYEVNRKVQALAPRLSLSQLEDVLSWASRTVNDMGHTSHITATIVAFLPLERALSVILDVSYPQDRADSILALLNRYGNELSDQLIQGLVFAMDTMQEQCSGWVAEVLAWQRLRCLVELMGRLPSDRLSEFAPRLVQYWNEAILNPPSMSVETECIALLPSVLGRLTDEHRGRVAKLVVQGICKLSWFETHYFRLPPVTAALDEALPLLSNSDQRRAFRKIRRKILWDDVAVQLLLPFALHARPERLRRHAVRLIVQRSLKGLEGVAEGGWSKYKPDLVTLTNCLASVAEEIDNGLRHAVELGLLALADAGKSSYEALSSDHGFTEAHRAGVLEHLVLLSSGETLSIALDIARRIGDQDIAAMVIAAILDSATVTAASHRANAVPSLEVDLKRHAFAILSSQRHNALTKINLVVRILPEIASSLTTPDRQQELHKLEDHCIRLALSLDELSVSGEPIVAAFERLAPVLTQHGVVKALESLEQKYGQWDWKPPALTEGAAELLPFLSSELRHTWAGKLRVTEPEEAKLADTFDVRSEKTARLEVDSRSKEILVERLCSRFYSSRAEFLKEIETELPTLAIVLGATGLQKLRFAIEDVTAWFE